MARSQDYNSASCQCLIVHEDSEDSLDGKYAAIGLVVSGIGCVDAICEDANPGYNGAIQSADQPVIESITIRTEE